MLSALVLGMGNVMILDWVFQCHMDNGHKNHPKRLSGRRGAFQILLKTRAIHNRFKIISVQGDEKNIRYLRLRLK